MLTLIGVVVLIAGFALRVNPLMVVAIAAVLTGLAAGLGPVEVVEMLGKAFVDNRFLAVPWAMLPVIGLLERGGIRERARALIVRARTVSTGRVLIFYLLVRQVSAALGLNALGGHVQMVRPVVAPMAEAAAEREGPLDDNTRDRIRAHAAAADNVGVFFGEDVFIAIGSILLIRSILQQYGILVAPLHVAVWAIPTAIAAFIVHGTRLLLLDRSLRRARNRAP